MTATWQSKSIGDEQIQDHLKQQLVKIAEYIGNEIANARKVRTQSREALDFADEILGYVVEVARNLAVYGNSNEEAVIAFKDLMIELFSVCRPLMIFAQTIILQLSLALPATEARHFAVLLTRIRTQ